ncbi:hypothetical protein R1sor_014113 [Riccia sorocarpa]|uniref:Endonuclease/exonuclease/phosphatase domain-containing protein n=1 Tax=Riccia sorocarpa TaxID=122646 RepID=A0ABD3HCC3_9MARC
MLQSQDKERQDRAGRELNLRIVGLRADADEDTREVVSTLLHDVLKVSTPRFDRAVRIGRSSDSVVEGGFGLWESADIVTLVETWVWKESVFNLPGFVNLISVWNPKRMAKGRGFGGIAVWIRESLSSTVTVEVVDVLKQFIILRLDRSKQTSFLVVAYYAPAGAPIYAAGDGGSPFMALSRLIIEFQEKGRVFVVGDFNSRSGLAQGEAPGGDMQIWQIS